MIRQELLTIGKQLWDFEDVKEVLDMVCFEKTCLTNEAHFRFEKEFRNIHNLSAVFSK